MNDPIWRAIAVEDRGFDDGSGWLHPETWLRAEGDRAVAVGAVLAAVAELSGWLSVLRFDPERDEVEAVAQELEAAAAALREACRPPS